MITLIGAGFLGSLYAEEAAKRLFALDTPRPWRVIDFDAIEARNCANQFFTPAEAGQNKARVVADRIEAYGFDADVIPERLTEANVEDLLGDSDLIVSATDNMLARNLAWYYANGAGIPLLHLGISQDGVGAVQWSLWDRYDSWILSPVALKGRPAPPDPVRTFRPCELVGFRGLGLNTVIAGAKSTGIWLGGDPERVLGKGTNVPARTFFVSWTTSQMDHAVEETYELTREEALVP